MWLGLTWHDAKASTPVPTQPSPHAPGECGSPLAVGSGQSRGDPLGSPLPTASPREGRTPRGDPHGPKYFRRRPASRHRQEACGPSTPGRRRGAYVAARIDNGWLKSRQHKQHKHTDSEQEVKHTSGIRARQKITRPKVTRISWQMTRFWDNGYGHCPPEVGQAKNNYQKPSIRR